MPFSVLGECLVSCLRAELVFDGGRQGLPLRVGFGAVWFPVVGLTCCKNWFWAVVSSRNGPLC